MEKSIYYKYLSPDRLSFFKDGLLRFTQPGDLNDPFECLPQRIDEEIFCNSVREILKKTTMPIEKHEEFIENDIKRDFLPNFIKNAYDKTNQEIGILSLTKNWNNSLMWSHYTNSHKGFCLGFDKTNKFFKELNNENSKCFRITKDVTYSQTRTKINVELPSVKPGVEVYLNKSIDWQYEDEIRVLATLNQSIKTISGNKYDIKLFYFPSDIIKEIIVGVYMEESHKDYIKEFCKMNGEIKLYQAEISNTKFDFERYRIN